MSRITFSVIEPKLGIGTRATNDDAHDGAYEAAAELVEVLQQRHLLVARGVSLLVDGRWSGCWGWSLGEGHGCPEDLTASRSQTAAMERC
jgi:hypothetical protein